MKKELCTGCGYSPCRCQALRELALGYPEGILKALGFKDPEEKKTPRQRMKIGGLRHGS